MGNVKVRKERYRRQGIAANPYPTAEEILASLAAGAVANLSHRAIAKARQMFNAAARNRRAGKRVKADPVSEVVATPKAETPPKKKKAKAKKSA